MHVAIESRAASTRSTIPVRIEELAAIQPESRAVRCGDIVMSYAELAQLMRRGGDNLRYLGCKPRERVALLADNHPLYVAAFMSIVGAGFSAVTIPTMIPASGIAEMLADCGARVLIASPRMKQLALDALAAMRTTGITVVDLDEAPTNSDLFFRRGAPIAHDLCSEAAAEFNIVYSSGTTGTPKGIVHSHRTRATLAAGFSGLGFDSSAVTVVSTPLYTNMSIPAFLGTLWSGGTVEVVAKFDAQEYLSLASRVGATHFFLVPTQVSRILSQANFAQFDLGNTRLKYVAGSRLAPGLKHELLTRWPGELVEVYGMTEGAPFTVLFGSAHPDKLESVGSAPPGCELRIIGADDELLPAGHDGEIVGRSGSMMLGYTNRPAETRDLEWRDDAGRIYFRSGDIGHLDSDGFLYIVDRKKDMIISGGYNIYSSDLENVLLQHPQVDQAAVVGVASASWGESPVAFVVPKGEGLVNADELKTWANLRLGKFARLARVELSEELPRNALGKVLKRVLREKCVPLP